MDDDVELEQVQAELYCAEKEVATLEAEMRRKVDEVACLKQRELTLLQQRSQRARPAAGSGGGLLVTAVWEDESGGDGQVETDAVEERGDVQCSTQELGNEAQIEFSQPISDISTSEKRAKVSKAAAFEIQRETAGTKREGAEALLCKLLNIEPMDLTSEDLEEFENCVEKVRKKMDRLQKSVKKAKRGVERPDETFLSSSMFEDLRGRIKAKQSASDEEIDDEGDPVRDDVLEEEGGRDEAGEEGGEQGEAGVVYRKNFTDLVPHSKDQKKRAAPLLKSLSDWCDMNGCSRLAVLGFMLHSCFPNKSTSLARFGWQLFTQGEEALLVEEVPFTVALWMVERLNLGRGRYTDMRLCLLR